MPHSRGFVRRKESRSSDPVPLGEVVEALLGREEFARGLPLARLAREWPELVGPTLAGATVPVSLEGGVLTIRASDETWASQARYLRDQVLERVVGALGPGSVSVVRVVIARPGEEVRNRR